MQLLAAVASIILIDLTLRGDNAVVIGMAAHALPDRQRRLAIVFGASTAIVLRVILTGVATILLMVPALKIFGGLLLVAIAFRLLAQEEEEHEHVKSAATLRAAILTIVTADFIMSTDNILAVAAAAHGSVGLLAFGLALSMPIMMFCGSIVATLLDRLWWLAYLGSGVIAWVGADLVLTDDLARSKFGDPGILTWIIPAE